MKIELQNLINQNIKVNAVITDPPYNISRKNNFHTMGRSGIDFGNWDKDFKLNWVNYLNDLTTENASLIIFVGLSQISEYILLLEQNNFIYKDMITWRKNNPMPRNVNRRYVSDREYALWFVKKNSKWVFNKNKDISYLRPEFKTSLVSTKDRLHPTQKHLELMKNLIKIHTNENDLILDCFMGSGTTILAAKQLNRNYIGIEIEKEYFNKVKELCNESKTITINN